MLRNRAWLIAFASLLLVGGLSGGSLDGGGGPSGGGDVVGPASSSDRTIVTYDGTTGKLLRSNTGVSIGASGLISASSGISSSSGSGNERFGFGTTAGVDSVVIGSSASGDGIGSVSIGRLCVASGDDSVVIGNGASGSTFDDVIIIGSGATAAANFDGLWGSVASPTKMTVEGLSTFNGGWAVKESGGATITLASVPDGTVLQRSGSSWIGNDRSTTQVAATATDTITSAEGVVQVDTMTITPGAGDYLVNFSTSTTLSGNGSEADFSLFVNGVEQAASLRTIGRGGNQTADSIMVVAISGYLVTGVAAAQVIEIRGAVDAGTVTIFERNLSVKRE